MFAIAGDAAKTQYLTHKINEEEYGTGPGGLSGNEDAGQMSAWLVFSMLGFYPVCPGSGEYILTSPAFEEISIQLPGGKFFRIDSKGLDKNNFYVKSSSVNGIKIKRYAITHKDIMEGCILSHQVSLSLQPVAGSR
jgi:putative alpha-1,2-mannosidase